MYKPNYLRIVLFTMTILCIAPLLSAEVPNVINYQGRLTDDTGTPITGSKLIKFKIYGSDTGNDSLWSSDFQIVELNDGLFNYQLGSNIALPEDLFAGNNSRYLGITIDTEAEQLPRTQFITVPYAHHASIADSAKVAPVSPDDDWIIDGNDVYHLTGNVGIGNSNPSENLVVGSNISSWNGNRVVIADDDPGVSTGLVIGEDWDNRSWILWDVDNSSFHIGTKEEGFNHSNAININEGNVGIQTTPLWDAILAIDKTYDITTYGEEGIGISSEVTNTGIDGDLYAGKFKASGSGSHGIYAKGGYYGGYFWSNYTGMYVFGQTIAASFSGDVEIFGNISKSGGSFKIDHPLDPENKYLQHSFVESPDMMNVYNGNIVTDENGNAEVILPDYFMALNKDFRYQLTVIGTFAQAIIAEKIQDDKFRIKTDQPNVEVSWQVTGIRKDPWANEHRIEVEVNKPEKERGYYIVPELYGYGKDRSIDQKLHRGLDSEKE